MKLEDHNLNAALASLLPRERRLIAMRQSGVTFKDIGEVFNRSAQWAYQQHAVALFKLKSRLKAGARTS